VAHPDNIAHNMVVALFLSMIGVCLGKPMGYEYPTPSIPFIEGTTMSTTSTKPVDCVPAEMAANPYYQSLLDLGTPLCDDDYDDYDEDDVPPDQAAAGYNYPTPQNPLTLPSKQTTTPLPLPDCVLYEEQDQGSNQEFLAAGVPLCPDYDEYDPNDIPTDQAKPLPDCVKVDEKSNPANKEYLAAGVPLCPEEELAGYEYPVPANPLTLPPRTTTTTPEEYDDYDPEDIPDDQAEPQGYEYPVPEIPFTLPAQQTTPRTTSAPDYDDYDAYDVPADQAEDVPDCVPAEDQDKGSNQKFVAAGVPICPPDEQKGYEYPVPQNPLTLPTKPTTTELPLPDCVKDSEKSVGPNPGFISAGVPLCPSEGYSYPVPSNPLQLPERSRKPKLVLEDDPDLLLIGLAHHEDDTYDPEYYDHNSADYLDTVDTVDTETEEEIFRSAPESGVSLTGVGKVFSFHVPSSFMLPPDKQKSRKMSSQNAIFDGSRSSSTLKQGSKGDKSKGRASMLSRMPKLANEHKDSNKSQNMQKTKNNRVGKSLGSKNKKISVQAWLRRG